MTPETLIDRVLRGEPGAWPWSADDESAAFAFLVASSRQHVMELVAWMSSRCAGPGAWPVLVRNALDYALTAQSARELIVQRHLTAVLDALAEAQVPALLTKGTALAYSVYPAPALRRRNDTDLIVPRHDVDRAAAVLRALGYRRRNSLAGTRVSHQAMFRKTDGHEIVHELDVHWKISNRPLFEDTLTWTDLAGDAVAVPALGDHARAIGPVHSLILACLHPVAHHGDLPAQRLRWLYDIHLLAGRMTAADFERWLALAHARRICAICLRGVEQARLRFDTSVPSWLTEALRSASAEASAWYLTRGPWRGDVRLSDLLTTPGIRQKLQLVRETVLPDHAYMRNAYGVASRALLAPFYVYRVACGSWSLLRRLIH
jgi:hypothetical protein